MRDTHVSGLHGASRDEWAALVESVTEHASIVAYTEFYLPVASRGQRGKLAPGWSQVGSGVECAVQWDRDRWTIGTRADFAGDARLTGRVFYTGKGSRKVGVVATWVLLTRQTRDPWLLLRVVAHFPASVQNGDRFSRKVRRVAAWVGALRGLRREVRRLIREHGPDEVTVSADWNVDLTRRRWRVVINTGLRGTGLRMHPAREGTHHSRAIDAHASTMRASAVHVLDKQPGFDHRPVGAVLNRKEK